jgi:hypothetical protein
MTNQNILVLNQKMAPIPLQRPMRFAHNLDTTTTFSEANLEHWLETHPDELTDVNINEIDKNGKATLRNGTRGGLSGAQLLEKVRSGQVWINLRNAFDKNEAGRSLLNRAFDQLVAANPSFKAQRVYANLLISAPNARVPFHSDTPEVALFHIAGHKRIYIYPNKSPYLNDLDVERVALRETTEDLPYNPKWDEAAEVFDLAPGDAIIWPTNAPHRVDNLGTLNVSLSCEFITWSSRLRSGAHYTNGTLRRRFHLSPAPYSGLNNVSIFCRWALSLILKKLPLNKAAQLKYVEDFSMTDNLK